MKFMLMMHAPRGTGDYQINQWKPEEFRAHIQFMKDLNKDLREAGELVERRAWRLLDRLASCARGVKAHPR